MQAVPGRTEDPLCQQRGHVATTDRLHGPGCQASKERPSDSSPSGLAHLLHCATSLSQQVPWAGLGYCVHSLSDGTGCPEDNVSWVEELGLSVSGTTGFRETRATQEVPGRSN